jgi:hypothetical protein
MVIIGTGEIWFLPFVGSSPPRMGPFFSNRGGRGGNGIRVDAGVNGKSNRGVPTGKNLLTSRVVLTKSIRTGMYGCPAKAGIANPVGGVRLFVRSWPLGGVWFSVTGRRRSPELLQPLHGRSCSFQ